MNEQDKKLCAAIRNLTPFNREDALVHEAAARAIERWDTEYALLLENCNLVRRNLTDLRAACDALQTQLEDARLTRRPSDAVLDKRGSGPFYLGPPPPAEGMRWVPIEPAWVCLDGMDAQQLAAYDYGCTSMQEALRRILDGEDVGQGVCSEPWQMLRQRVLDLVQQKGGNGA